LFFEATRPQKSILDRVASFLEDDLLGDMLEDPALAQDEGTQMLAFGGEAARCSRADATASRRFVLMRSPGCFGIRTGATTMQL
jgi:hypothetical protein